MRNISIKFPTKTSESDKEALLSTLRKHVTIDETDMDGFALDITITFDDFNLFDKELRGARGLFALEEHEMLNAKDDFKELLMMVAEIRNKDFLGEGLDISIDFSNENMTAEALQYLLEEFDIKDDEYIYDGGTILIGHYKDSDDKTLPDELAIYIGAMNGELKLISYAERNEI